MFLELTLHKQETFPPSKMDVLSTILYIVLLGLLWFVKLSWNKNNVLYYNEYSKQHNFSSHIPETTFGCFQLLRSSTMERIVISEYGNILSIIYHNHPSATQWVCREASLALVDLLIPRTRDTSKEEASSLKNNHCFSPFSVTLKVL